MGAHDTHQTQDFYLPCVRLPYALQQEGSTSSKPRFSSTSRDREFSVFRHTHTSACLQGASRLVYRPAPPPNRGIECPNFDSTCTPTATFDPRVLSPRSGAPRGKRGPAQALHRLLVRRGPRHDAQPSCQARHGDSPSLGREQRAPPASQSNGSPSAEAMGWKEARRPPQAALGSVA
jgi:hypothetical protein